MCRPRRGWHRVARHCAPARSVLNCRTHAVARVDLGVAGSSLSATASSSSSSPPDALTDRNLGLVIGGLRRRGLRGPLSTSRVDAVGLARVLSLMASAQGDRRGDHAVAGSGRPLENRQVGTLTREPSLRRLNDSPREIGQIIPERRSAGHYTNVTRSYS